MGKNTIETDPKTKAYLMMTDPENDLLTDNQISQYTGCDMLTVKRIRKHIYESKACKLLDDPDTAYLSDDEISWRSGCSKKTVAKIRQEMQGGMCQEKILLCGCLLMCLLSAIAVISAIIWIFF